MISSDNLKTVVKDNWKTFVRLGVRVMLGIVLIVVAVGLMSATYTRKETRVVPGNRDETIAVGAVTGAGVGVGAGAAIGGAGVVCCGTGFGIPVGVVCLGLGALLGLAGGGIGAAVGSPDREEDFYVNSPFAEPWIWGVLLLVGIGLVMYGVVGMIHLFLEGAESKCKN